MRNFISLFIILWLSYGITGCNKTETNNLDESNVPFSGIEPINSSQWAVNPSDYGLTAEKFIRAESLHFMKGMSAREGINNFFHFKSLSKAEDKWVVSPNNDVIYSMAIVLQRNISVDRQFKSVYASK